MRQAINNLQSAFYGFKYINSENVFKVCDQPHPVVIHSILESCSAGNVKEALASIKELWDQGYSALDIVTTLFRVVKSYSNLDEGTKLEYIKVGCPRDHPPEIGDVPVLSRSCQTLLMFIFVNVKEIGFAHMHILEGVQSLVQLYGLVSKMCKITMKPEYFIV